MKKTYCLLDMAGGGRQVLTISHVSGVPCAVGERLIITALLILSDVVLLLLGGRTNNVCAQVVLSIVLLTEQ